MKKKLMISLIIIVVIAIVFTGFITRDIGYMFRCIIRQAVNDPILSRA